jgi:hypothetical protein
MTMAPGGLIGFDERDPVRGIETNGFILTPR